MTKLREDDGLRDEFLRLRAETELPGRVPDVAPMLARARSEAAALPRLAVVDGGQAGRRSPGRRLLRAGGWASAALAATAAGLLLLADRGPGGDEDFERLVAAYAGDAAAGAWTSPTSGLLSVPGLELMRSVPSVGAPARGLDPSTRPAPRAPQSQESNG